MSILTKVLIGLVIVAVFPVIYFAGGVLNMQDVWHKKVQQLQAQVKQEQARYDLLLNGDLESQTAQITPGKPVKGTPGYTQWKTARDAMMRGVGRVWYARPVAASISGETGTLSIEMFDDKVNDTGFGTTRQPLSAHGLTDKTFLYVFQMNHNGEPMEGKDRYVGEFIVNGLPPGANEPLIPLKPTFPLPKEEWDRLKADSGGQQWVVYDKMPQDSRDLFVGQSREEIAKQVPAGVVDEYEFDNQPPTDAVRNNEYLKQFIVKDPKSGAEKFLRPLRNYAQIFQGSAEQLSDLNMRLQVLKREKDFADQALANLEKTAIPALDAHRMRLEKEKALVDADLTVVNGQAERLAAAVEQMRQEIVRLVTENKQRLQKGSPGDRLTDASAAQPGKVAAVRAEPIAIP